MSTEERRGTSSEKLRSLRLALPLLAALELAVLPALLAMACNSPPGQLRDARMPAPGDAGRDAEPSDRGVEVAIDGGASDTTPPPVSCPHALTSAAACPGGCRWVPCCGGPPFWCATPCATDGDCAASVEPAGQALACADGGYCVPRCGADRDCPYGQTCVVLGPADAGADKQVTPPPDGGGDDALPGDSAAPGDLEPGSDAVTAADAGNPGDAAGHGDAQTGGDATGFGDAAPGGDAAAGVDVLFVPLTGDAAAADLGQPDYSSSGEAGAQEGVCNI